MAYTTRPSLLNAIKNGDQVAWESFYTTYSPLILFCGRKSGIREDELSDLVQRVMLKFFNTQKNFSYTPSKGKFRSYFGRVIASVMSELLAERRDDLLPLPDELPSESQLKQVMEDEWQKHVFQQALLMLREKVSEETFQAFDMYALQNMDAQKVSAFIGISVQNVYDAKTRCVRMMKDIIHTLNEE